MRAKLLDRERSGKGNAQEKSGKNQKGHRLDPYIMNATQESENAGKTQRGNEKGGKQTNHTENRNGENREYEDWGEKMKTTGNSISRRQVIRRMEIGVGQRKMTGDRGKCLVMLKMSGNIERNK